MERGADCNIPHARKALVSTPDQDRARQVKARAKAIGFDACGIAVAGNVDPNDNFGQWVARGLHADMDWLAKTIALRQDARVRLPGARSVVVVARTYFQERPPAPPRSGRVARYAWGKDYHKALKAPLRALARFVDALDVEEKSCISIDDKGVMERAWAERAGIGWVGKNSLILNRELGSWILLGTVITTLALAPDAPVQAHCGTCRACIDACPTQAIIEDGVVDARRCISYHTIENMGAVPGELQPHFSNWIFGCDICQEACPWNRFAAPPPTPAIPPRPGIANPLLDEVAAMDQAGFDTYFAGTPVRRATHAGMLRNVGIAMKNVQDLHDSQD